MGTTVSKNNGLKVVGETIVVEEDDEANIRKRSLPKNVRASRSDDLDVELIQRNRSHRGDPALTLDHYLGRGGSSPIAPALVGSVSSADTVESPLTSPESSPSSSPGNSTSGSASVSGSIASRNRSPRASYSGHGSSGAAPASSPTPVRKAPAKDARAAPLPLNSYIRRICTSGVKSRSKTFCMSQSEIKDVCSAAQQVFLDQPALLELSTPVKVVGDIHGQFQDLLRIFQTCGMPPKTNYLFLGDYVDRGKQSLETVMLLLCLKLRYPGNVFMLRGNHESANVTKVYGFYDECKRRASLKTWRTLVDVFNTLPIAAIIGEKIFCVHGGLSPDLKSLEQISGIQRPTDVPETGLISDLLWSDPDPQTKEWGDNDRGVSFCFGKRALETFCRRFGFDLVARGHMVVQDGYEFFGRQQLVTVFSAPNYCGEFDNWGAVMCVNEELLCSFDLLEPRHKIGGSR